MLRGLGRAVRGAVAAAACGAPHTYSAGRCSVAALSGSSRACSAACDLSWAMPQRGSQPSPVPAALPRGESVRGIRTSSAARGSCFYWTGELDSCPAGDACKHNDSHTPGIPSPYRFCPDWTGERGSCPRGLACKGVVLHVPGRPSPTLQAQEEAEPAGQAASEHAAAPAGAGLPYSAGDAEAPEAGASQGAALASLGEAGAGECEEGEEEVEGDERSLYQAPLEDGDVEGEDADIIEGADVERGEDGEGEEGDLVKAASPAEDGEVGEALDEGDELEDEETDEDYLDLYEAAAETQLAFEEMFTRPPAGKPPHPDAEGADAWDPAPPSAALIEPGVERLSSPMYDIDDFDTMMDEWERLIIKGHHGAALTLVENAISDVPSLPPLHELQRRKSDRELRKEAARARAAALRAMYAARRIVRVNEHGCAHGAGRRKTSSAQVWLQAGTGNVRINRMPLDVAFPTFDRRIDVLAPFRVTSTCGDFDMVATVRGGGEMGQSQAVRLALSRALENYHPPLRADLKPEGFMTRDPRMVERKKPGRKKARKAFQWVKR